MSDTRLFTRILCPVDFSDHSRGALGYAALLAARLGARLVVIFVEDPMLAAAAAVAYDEKTLIDKGRKELRRLTERAIAPHGLSIDDVTLDVAVGRPHEIIAWTARELACDLIVMGAHGLTGANRLMIGSTTHRVLRESPLPVLATPPAGDRVKGPPRRWPGKSAVAPIDLGTRDRSDALSAATAARELGVQLELVHVLEPVGDIPWLEVDAFRRNTQRHRRALARLTRLQDELKDTVTRVHVAEGAPAAKIAAQAADAHVGLVIMTRRRGRGLFGPRQGSISYEVLCKARTPVLALPGDSSWMRRVIRRRK